MLQAEYQFDGSVNLFHSILGKGSSKKRAFRLRIKETRRVQRTDLKTEKHSISWKTCLLCCHSNICGIITRHIPCVSTEDHRDNKRLLVDGVSRDYKNRSISCLFSALSGAKIDKINLASANHSSNHRSRSGGILLRSQCIRL